MYMGYTSRPFTNIIICGIYARAARPLLINQDIVLPKYILGKVNGRA